MPAEVCPPLEAACGARRGRARRRPGSSAASSPAGATPTATTGSEDAVSDDYNITRHAGVMMGLYRLAAETGDDEGPRGGRSRASVSAREPRPAGRVGSLRRARAGGAASARARSPSPPSSTAGWRRAIAVDDELMRALGRFLVAQQLPDGRVLGYWSPRTGAAGSRPVREVRNRGGAVGARARQPPLPGRGLGAPGAAPRALRRDAARRRRGLRPHLPGPLGGVRARRARARAARRAPRSRTRAASPAPSGSRRGVEAQSGEEGHQAALPRRAGLGRGPRDRSARGSPGSGG